MKSDEERQERGDVLETRQFGLVSYKLQWLDFHVFFFIRKIKERKITSNKNLEVWLKEFSNFMYNE